MTTPRPTPLAVSRLLGGAIALLLITPALGQTDLRWRLAPDDQLDLVLSQVSSTEAEIAGRTYKSSLNITATLSWRVIAVDENGAAAIEQRLSRLALAADLPGAAPLKYDSSSQEQLSGAAKNVADEFRPLLGKPVRVRLLPTGEIADARQAPQADDQNQPQAPFTLRDIRQLLGRLLPALPPAPVSPGDSWDAVSEQATPEGKVKIAARYVARGAEMTDGRPAEKIQASYDFAAVKGKELTLEFAGQENHGAFFFDATAGRLREGEIRQSMTLQLGVGDSKVAQKSKSVSTIKLRAAEQ